MKFEIYTSDDGYCWRLRGSDGCIMAVSGGCYASRDDAVREVTRLRTLPAVMKLHAAVATAKIVDV